MSRLRSPLTVGWGSLRSALMLLLLLAAAMPLLIFGVVMTDRFAEAMIASELVNSRQRGELAADNLRRDLQNISSRTAQLALDNDLLFAPTSAAFAGVAMQKVEQLLVGDNDAVAALLVDAQGELVDATPVELLVEPPPVLATIAASLPGLVSADNGLPQLVVAHEDDQPSRLLLLQPLLLNALADAPASRFVGALVVVVDAPFWQRRAEQALGDYRLLGLLLNDQALLPLQPVDRQRVMVETLTLPVTPQLTMTLQVGFDRERLTAHGNSLRQQGALTVALAMVLLIPLVWLLVHRFLRSFRQIAGVVEGYAQGDYRPRQLPMPFTEQQQLMAVLAAMAKRVMADQELLEQRVAERTAALAAANDEIHQHHEEMLAIQRHLMESEKLAHLGQLVAGVAHEINTPVGVALTAASHQQQLSLALQQQMASGNLKRSELDQGLAGISDASALVVNNLMRAADLINSFKEVAVDQTSEQRRRFNFHGYLHEVLASLQGELKRQAVTVRVSGDEQLVLTSYPGAFGQLLTNFIVNSLRHGLIEGQPLAIAISFEQRGSELQLLYRDDGQGMSGEVLERLFEPFFTTKRNQGGTGLGLYIVYNLISQKLGGSVVACSAPGYGVAYRVRLPLA